MKMLFRVQIVLASIGSLLFLTSILIGSHALWAVGISMMVGAVLVLLPVYLRGINRRNRLLSAATISYALIAGAWLAVPALHGSDIVPFVVGLSLAACGLGLGYGWWRFERQVKATPK